MTKIEKNLKLILDHSQTDPELRKLQERLKKKIIEAKNEAECDSVLRTLLSMVRNYNK